MRIAQFLHLTINRLLVLVNVRGREILVRSGSGRCHFATTVEMKVVVVVWLPWRAGCRSVLFDTIPSVKMFPGAALPTV